MEKLITLGLVLLAAYTIYVAVTPNHLFIG
jgi:hypothetical protein